MSLGSGRATTCGGGSFNPSKAKKNQPLDNEPRRSPIKTTRANRPQSSQESKGAHLTERMVLLLEPLQAALLRHGKTLPAYTATAPAETLKQSPRPPARTRGPGHPIGDPIKSNPAVSRS
jgi:hypothetical protein